DELDNYYLSKYPKNPDMRLSAVQEFEEAMCFLKELYSVFPMCRVCYSNHGNRPLRKLLEAYIPSIYMREYRQLLEAPSGWQWARSWKVKTKHPFIVEHGHKFKGTHAHMDA